LLERHDIETLLHEHERQPAERLAQKQLAYKVTDTVHGKDQADKQQRIVQVISGDGDPGSLDASEITILSEEGLCFQAQPGTPIIEIMVRTGLASSNSEARRFLQSKAIYVNNQPFSKAHLETSDFKNGRLMLRRGKAYKDSALIELG